jgi:SAM-dependent methyltransferase
MDFRYKCFMQQIFSLIPKGEQDNYLFQKFITKSLPPTNDEFLRKVDEALLHHQNYVSYNSTQSTNKQYYEFGAGWTMTIPLAMSLLGFKVNCIDIRKLIIPELIHHTIEQFKTNVPSGLPKPNMDGNESFKHQNILSLLEKHFAISYNAPVNAKNTGFEENSFDFISSTATLEHIPESDLLPIFQECYRILKSGGVFSIIVDYQDHWSYFDSSISIYNYLKYSSVEWKKYNPALHYQNRLRHSDYLKLISLTNFKVVKNNPLQPNEDEIVKFKQTPIAKEFLSYITDDLMLKSAEIVLTKQ